MGGLPIKIVVCIAVLCTFLLRCVFVWLEVIVLWFIPGCMTVVLDNKHFQIFIISCSFPTIGCTQIPRKFHLVRYARMEREKGRNFGLLSVPTRWEDQVKRLVKIDCQHCHNAYNVPFIKFRWTFEIFVQGFVWHSSGLANLRLQHRWSICNSELFCDGE